MNVLGEEIEVLEEPEHAEVAREAPAHEQPSPRWHGRHPASRPVVDNGRRENQQQEPRMHVAVKEVAGDEQKEILAPMAQTPVENDGDDEEDDEVDAVERHRANIARRARNSSV